MEQLFYLCNRTTEEEQAFIKGLAQDINEMGTATFNFDFDDEYIN